jgi:hypothetical protein
VRDTDINEVELDERIKAETRWSVHGQGTTDPMSAGRWNEAQDRNSWAIRDSGAGDVREGGQEGFDLAELVWE